MTILNWFDKLSAMIYIQLYDEIIAEISLSTTEQIIHDGLKMTKVTSRWVSHQLTDEQE